MAVCRVEKSNNYTVMANYHLDDHGLSLKAKGLLSTMLRLPDDWDYTIGGLAALCKDGKAAIQSTIDELEAAGYIKRRQLHSEDGTFAGNEYTIFESPQKPVEDVQTPPLTDFPLTEKPLTENQPQPNTNIPSTNITNTPLPPKRGRRVSGSPEVKKAPDWKPERFRAFWEFYPRGESKQAAIKAWDKLKPDDDTLEAMGKKLKEQMQTAEWRRGIGIPHASTYLNQRRWEDETRPPGNSPAPAQSRVIEAQEVAEL